MKNTSLLLAITWLSFLSSPICAQLNEGFENVNDLAPPSTLGNIISGGWFGQLRSFPLGPVGIFQGVPPDGMGNGGGFTAHSGPDNSFVGVSFANAGSFTENDVVSTWIMSPEITLENGKVISFYTRTVPMSMFPDRLNVRLSTNGSSVEVGGNPFTIGSFDTLLMSINPDLELGGYPDDWTQFEVEIKGLAGPTQGRFAFHYFVPDLSMNANSVGIDSLTYGDAAPDCMLGDANGDGTVDLLDVGPFVDILTMGSFQCESDINQDGVVDLLDVQPFIELLSGG